MEVTTVVEEHVPVTVAPEGGPLIMEVPAPVPTVVTSTPSSSWIDIPLPGTNTAKPVRTPEDVIEFEKMRELLDTLQSKVLELESSRVADKDDNFDAKRRIVQLTRDLTEQRDMNLSALDRFKTELDQVRPIQPNGGKQVEAKDRTYGYILGRYSDQFPKFDPVRSEMDLMVWEEYWESVESFRRITGCSDMIVAYLIRDTAPPHSPLATCLSDIRNVGGNGYEDIHDVGLAGIKKRMQDDFGPKLHNMADQARRKYENTRRRFKERPKWFFRRLEFNEKQMNRLDPEHKVSSSFRAKIVFENSGLERKERAKVYKEAGKMWDYEKFKSIILDRYETKHEVDCAMVERAFKNKNRFDAARTYVVDNPETGVQGTDLYMEDCDEDCLDDSVDLSIEFDPLNPVYVATELELEDANYDDFECQLCDEEEVGWMNEYGEIMDDDDDCNSVYTAFSGDEQEAFDAYSVEWICQDDGSYVPWQWYEQSPDVWSCYLARDWTHDDDSDEEEERRIGEMADIYVAMSREVAKEMDSFPDATYFDKLRENFIADTKLKRSYGKPGRAKLTGSGSGKSKFSDKGKGKGGKGKSRGRRLWGPRKKGPKRSQSRTRGYASNPNGRKIFPSKVPFKKEHLKDKCRKCNHKTAAGEPVAPHRFGDLICPEVQAGRVLCHPRWEKFAAQYPHVKFYRRKDHAGKGKGKGKSRDSSDRQHRLLPSGPKGKGKKGVDHDRKVGMDRTFGMEKKNFSVNVVSRIEEEADGWYDAGSEYSALQAEMDEQDRILQSQRQRFEQLGQVQFNRSRVEPEFRNFQVPPGSDISLGSCDRPMEQDSQVPPGKESFSDLSKFGQVFVDSFIVPGLYQHSTLHWPRSWPGIEKRCIEQRWNNDCIVPSRCQTCACLTETRAVPPGSSSRPSWVEDYGWYSVCQKCGAQDVWSLNHVANILRPHGCVLTEDTVVTHAPFILLNDETEDVVYNRLAKVLEKGCNVLEEDDRKRHDYYLASYGDGQLVHWFGDQVKKRLEKTRELERVLDQRREDKTPVQAPPIATLPRTQDPLNTVSQYRLLQDRHGIALQMTSAEVRQACHDLGYVETTDIQVKNIGDELAAMVVQIRDDQNRSRRRTDYNSWKHVNGSRYPNVRHLNEAWQLQKAVLDRVQLNRQEAVLRQKIDIRFATLDELLCLKVKVTRFTVDMVDAILEQRARRQFLSRKDLLSVAGIGPKTFKDILPYLKPLSDTDEDPKDRGKESCDWTPAHMPFKPPNRTLVAEEVSYLPTLQTSAKSLKPGQLWADSGCVRGTGGKKEHTKIQRYMRDVLGLTPVFAPCQESFQFGNGEVTRATRKVLYPVFMEGVYRGVLDEAEVPVDCPMLLSKMVLRKWDADMCFGKGVTRVNKFDLEVPFNEQDIPVINILDVTPDQIWNQWYQIPEQFRL